MDWNSIDYSSPKVMGILNVTPDSFYDGGSYTTENAIQQRLEKMLDEGADIVDIGAYSSRPGAADVPEDEELNRLWKVLQIIKRDYPEIQGVMIVCEGGDISKVKNEVTNAVCALLGISANNVSVTKMKSGKD